MATLKKKAKAKKRRKDYKKKYNLMKYTRAHDLLPPSKKNKVSKKQTKRREKIAGNFIKTVTGR